MGKRNKDSLEWVIEEFGDGWCYPGSGGVIFESKTEFDDHVGYSRRHSQRALKPGGRLDWVRRNPETGRLATNQSSMDAYREPGVHRDKCGRFAKALPPSTDVSSGSTFTPTIIDVTD